MTDEEKISALLISKNFDLEIDESEMQFEQVKAEGHRVIDEAPRPGSRGTTVAFMHPKGSFGTLIELVQE